MQDNRIRIASYNIRKARGLDQKRNPHRILEVVNGLEADVVALQEADKRLGVRAPAVSPELIEGETDFRVIETSTNGISLGWHGNAVLVRKGIITSAVTRLTLPGLEPRGAVRLTLDVFGGIDVVAAHLGLRRRDRRAQLALIEGACQKDRRSVIAGDFNEWSATRGFEALEERFDVISPGRSFHARRPIAGLDRFALSKGIAIYDAGVQQNAVSRIASDHLPIWADITEIPLTC
ncbi:endonuclease/exonuclease/phosphatase family protein [Sulfitobacter donghicola]|nr:endonuclease/exonuclease/phosphatase family protein [Sulfitobacter donghicola]